MTSPTTLTEKECVALIRSEVQKDKDKGEKTYPVPQLVVKHMIQGLKRGGTNISELFLFKLQGMIVRGEVSIKNAALVAEFKSLDQVYDNVDIDKERSVVTVDSKTFEEETEEVNIVRH